MSTETVWARQYLDKMTAQAESIMKAKNPEQTLALASIIEIGMMRVIAEMLIEIAEHLEDKE